MQVSDIKNRTLKMNIFVLSHPKNLLNYIYIFIAVAARGKKLFLCLPVLVENEIKRPFLRLEKHILSKKGM